MKKKHIALLIFLLILAAIVAGGLYYYIRESKQYEEHFFRGTFVNGMSVEGMTADEVESLLEASADRNYSLTVAFPESGTEVITADDIAYNYESDGSVRKLMNAQKPLEWIRGYLHDSVVTIPVNMGYDEALLDQVIDSFPEWQNMEVIEPVDAYMDFQDHRFVVVPDVRGRQPDIEKMKQMIRDAVALHAFELNLLDTDPYIYTEAAVTADDEKLNETVNTLNEYVGAAITYDLPGTETQVLDGSVLIDWLVTDEDGNYRKDEELWNEKIREYVAALAEKVDTLGTVKEFPATGIGMIPVTLMTYGYQMDQESEIAWLTEALNEGAVTLHTPAYFSWETSEPDDNNGFGRTYVEIDCSRQHLWAYQDGEIAFETDIVSGAMTEDRATPSGVYMFVTKESPSTLVGKDDNGNVIYRTQVSYFMPFNSMAIGIHDATWQAAFGGTRYLEGFGSHGCINVPYYAAETLYDMINFEEPVIVYY